MSNYRIVLFKDSFEPITGLLKENGIEHQIPMQRSGVMAGPSGVIEVLQSPAIWAALSTVIVSYLKYKNSRKVMITTKDNKVVHAEGLNEKELEEILESSKEFTAFDSRKDKPENEET